MLETITVVDVMLRSRNAGPDSTIEGWLDLTKLAACFSTRESMSISSNAVCTSPTPGSCSSSSSTELRYSG